MIQPQAQSGTSAIQRSPDQSAVAHTSGATSRKHELVAGATSFEEGEARLAPPGTVQLKTSPEGEGQADDAAAPAKDDPFAAERAKLDAAGRAALSALPETSQQDAGNTPGDVGQGDIGESNALPDWFMEIQNRLVASSTWGEAEENAQHAIRDYAMLVARANAGPGGKVPEQIAAFFDYIGRGTKNDSAARKAGYKGSADLTGAQGAKDWCAGAATQAARIGRTQGRVALLADLKARGLEPIAIPAVFFSNLAQLSGSGKAKQFYNETAYAEPLEPGDRVDYLFDGCQYGGHAVHVVADLGDAFLHVSGNTTRHSAVATGQAKRLKTKPAGLNMGIANDVSSDESKRKATEHIATVSFGGGKLVYMIQRHSDPYKALQRLETDDPSAFEAALKSLLLRRTAPAAPEAAPPG